MARFNFGPDGVHAAGLASRADQLHLDRRRRGSQHQCVLGGKHRALASTAGLVDRPLALGSGVQASPSPPAILNSLGLSFGDAFFVAAFAIAARLYWRRFGC